MLLEREIASIMSFATIHAGEPNVYYYNVPESFAFPAIYYPQPEIDTGGETFETYYMQYTWYIMFFAKTTEDAHEMAFTVLTALKKNRNLIPLLDDDGAMIHHKLRVDDPALKRVDDGAVQLVLTWKSRRPYNHDDTLKMVHWQIHGWEPDNVVEIKRLETAFENAVHMVSTTYARQEYASKTRSEPF